MTDRTDKDAVDESGYVSYETIEHAADVLGRLDKDLDIDGVQIGLLVDMLNELLERRDADEQMDDATRYALGAM